MDDKNVAGYAPVAMVVSKYGDPEAFGERELKFDDAVIQKLPYNTPLYLAAPLPQGDAEEHIWVLTRAINDYSQDGEYFVHAWNYHPSLEQLMQQNCTETQAKHCIESGGGRVGGEGEWYMLNVIDAARKAGAQ